MVESSIKASGACKEIGSKKTSSEFAVQTGKKKCIESKAHLSVRRIARNRLTALSNNKARNNHR